MLEAIAAAHAGRMDVAERSLEQMRSLNPSITGELGAYFDRLNINNQDLLETVTTGLAMSGLSH